MLCIKIIGECAVNWNDLEEAKRLIKACKEAGIWACKFQLYNKANLRLIEDPLVQEYCLRRMLDYNSALELFEYGKSIGQEVFFTCMYPESVDICERIGVNYYKVRCFDKFNKKIIYKIIKTKKPYFVSVDGIFQDQKYDFGDFLLFCVPKYPANIKDYWEFFEFMPHDWNGISDHTSCTCLLQIAQEYGVKYFEKHVRMRDGFIEDPWSVKIEEIREVLRK